MQYLLLGLVCGLVAGIPFDYGRDGWMKKWFIITVGYGMLSTLVAWFLLPQLVGPLWGPGLWGMMMAGLVFNLLWSMVSADAHHNGVQLLRLPRVALFNVMFLLIPVVGGLRSCAAFHADEYRAFVEGNVEEGEWKDDMVPIDTAHIRMVSEEQAQWLAQKALGQSMDMGIGSRFKVGEATIQKMGNQLVWIAPLEFQGFSAWKTSGTTPGYVIVDAEDPSKPAVLKEGFKLRYLPSAAFGDNLSRHLYEHGYQFIGTTDYSFEVDDEGNPFYVVDVYEPTIGYFGHQILKVAVLDPQTGEITEYLPGAAPAWIDRIVPLEFATDRLVDYGKFVHGWKNSWWDEVDVNVPSATYRNKKGEKTTFLHSSLWLTWGDDGQAYWFTGLTSSKSSDDSLVGFVLMNSRTGHTRRYQLPGGTDAVGVMEAVNSSVSNYDGWHATQPILYNLYGQLTWVVPVISSTNIFQRLALVRASNTKVILGEDKARALELYRQYLVQENGNTEDPSGQAKRETIKGVIGRIACPVFKGDTVCFLTLAGDEKRRVFSGGVEKSLFMTIARPGDYVSLDFLETKSVPVPIEKFTPMDPLDDPNLPNEHP